MSIIGARKDDWRPGRADIKPAYWERAGALRANK